MSAESKTTYREIFSIVLLRTLPVVVIVVFLFRTARHELSLVTSLPALIYNSALAFALFLVLKFTAGPLLSKLVAEGQDKSGQAGG